MGPQRTTRGKKTLKQPQLPLLLLLLPRRRRSLKTLRRRRTGVRSARRRLDSRASRAAAGDCSAGSTATVTSTTATLTTKPWGRRRSVKPTPSLWRRKSTKFRQTLVLLLLHSSVNLF